jgi:hypothetical protein
MGFLDHSTNNIIIDAVLTNIGREMLASNAGMFLIDKFSLSDDEVDYSLITKFGRTVGKEKIIKNTPIFEAQTGSDIAQKFRCQTVMDPTVTHLPVVVIDSVVQAHGTGVTSVTSGNTVSNITIKWNNMNSATVTASQKMLTENAMPDGLTDMFYDVYVNNLFVVVDGGSYNALDPLSNIARYALSKSGGNLTFTLKSRGMEADTFTLYQDPGAFVPDQITTVMSIVGRNSGARADCTIVVQHTG